MSRYSPEEAALLSRYVSNLDRNVYAIWGLPEEVIAVVFARVSRSPASFRDNLLSLIRDRELALASPDGEGPPPEARFDLEKARRFHERVVIGYGHSSVAELAVAHVGIERISRLASARLELANPFLSFVEYSQRYQRPARGGYVVPPELEERPDLRGAFEQLQDETYRAYEELQAGLVDYLRGVIGPREGEGEKAWRSRLEKIAFEDARYALTLAVHTNLGLTGNGRALRDAIVRLLSDPYPECRRLAAAMREEVSAVLPVLLRHAEESPYQTQTRLAFEAELGDLGSWAPRGAEATRSSASGAAGPRAAVLLDWTGRDGTAPEAGPARDAAPAGDSIPPDEVRALRTLLEGALTTHSRLGGEALRRHVADLPADRLVRLARVLVDRLGPHDHPHDAFHRVAYEVEFCVSEACWHQLLRHSRKVDFAPAEPRPDDGWVVPPNVRAAGLEGVLARAVEASEALYRRLLADAPLAAPYVLTGAHRRRARARFDLWELYHLVNLRGGPEAQWEIREAILDLNEQVRRVHPHLAPTRRRA
ncbi:FAD-dependent thymidylate synthase [Caldinitratiruptor microaerophilus]|uniref:Thymidylate synthase n=1 Tax=Caldinitratiruptor microaerophilus TaxID=671077 RepID=A0AA35CMX3_9FIRM|nr:FAD-dependent thymidylate synthase [Caldinitratiruptor microaerophilus]BDG62132.1 thymidylate synthase [Caldinitratiruptor microaerophilus]